MHELYDDMFKAMADPHRRQIMAALCERPMVASDLARLVQLAPNAVSFHLKWLKSAGLVAVHRQGKYLRYELVSATLTDWRNHVGAIFASREPVAAALEVKVVGGTIGTPPRMSPASQAAQTSTRLKLAASPRRQRPTHRTPAPIIEQESLPTELL
jgi:DNA-binding transcriptional ArsR family regulator